MSEKTKHYTEEFKKQIVSLHLEGGRKASELAKEYGIANSSVTKWARDFKNSGSFKVKDNRTPRRGRADSSAERSEAAKNGERHTKASRTKTITPL